MGGIDTNSTSVFFEKILRYYYIPTIGVADSQAPLNNRLQSSLDLLMIKIAFSQPYVHIERDTLIIKLVTVSGSSFHCAFSFVRYTQGDQFVKRSLGAGNDILLPVQTQSTKQNGCPGGFCSSG